MRKFLISLLLAMAGAAAAASAQTLSSHVETMRDYDLVEIDGRSESRPLRFYIGENSAFAICGHCLCGTGIMTRRFPKLGIRPTSASPTLDCKQDSAAFRRDADLVALFFEMTRAQVSGDLLLLSGPGERKMVFRLGGSELSPP